jgi:erythronate-4-phosphate dehydrogenase
MKIVADQDIPFISHYFGGLGEISLKLGRTLTREDVLTADILLVRSVTLVNQALLDKTKVKFVGSVVSGMDHLDTIWLDQAGIRWSSAAGCNATAVAEYVVTVIAALQKSGLLSQKKCRAAVIGAGKIGSQVVEKLKILGFEVVQCDPLRAIQEENFASTPIEELAELDFISLHTPLTQAGPYPTYHLIEKKFLQRQKKDCVLLNTSRGAVINGDALIQYGQHLIKCLDVWEYEPKINEEVLLAATLASPHIAGHSIQSKYRGIDRIYGAAIQQGIIPAQQVPSVPFPTAKMTFSNKKIDWREAVLAIYNPGEITQRMKQAFLEEGSGVFDELRKRFIRGHEFQFVKISQLTLTPADRKLLAALSLSGFEY